MTLRAARARRKWTQERLSAVSGLKQAHISKIERGEIPNPSHATVVALERALRVRPGTLVFGRQSLKRAS